MLVYNAQVYTVDSSFTVTEAIAIDKGKIIETGTSESLQKKYKAATAINAEGKFIYPGFIDAHTHFVNYANGLQTANLVNTDSWDSILQMLIDFEKKLSKDQWLTGRGWDQNDWAVKEFPTNEKLNHLFPDRPVVLSRIDGHAAIANQKALDIAGIKAGDKLDGGVIEMKNGKLTGILIDNAVAIVTDKIPSPRVNEFQKNLTEAQQNCFAVGLTTVDDCGLDYETVLLLDSLQKAGSLKMRIYAMLSDAKKNYDFAFTNGKIKTDYLNVGSFKVYADGALGSRGASLLQPYSDKPGWSGFLLSSQKHFDSVANVIAAKGWQMCTHAIGDSANRTILHIYANHLKTKNDLRWRIEHAQVVNPSDFEWFGKYTIIPSVQPTHATSDMYWAGKRLGSEREKGAYAYKQLLDQNGWIALGTDFPVEDISPFKTFYAAVVRKDVKGWPAQGYQINNALKSKEALKGMTIWAAKANFEEHEKGSIEKGKLADFIILDRNLLDVRDSDILATKVLKTIVGGTIVYEIK